MLKHFIFSVIALATLTSCGNGSPTRLSDGPDTIVRDPLDFEAIDAVEASDELLPKRPGISRDRFIGKLTLLTVMDKDTNEEARDQTRRLIVEVERAGLKNLGDARWDKARRLVQMLVIVDLSQLTWVERSLAPKIIPSLVRRGFGDTVDALAAAGVKRSNDDLMAQTILNSDTEGDLLSAFGGTPGDGRALVSLIDADGRALRWIDGQRFAAMNTDQRIQRVAGIALAEIETIVRERQ